MSSYSNNIKKKWLNILAKSTELAPFGLRAFRAEKPPDIICRKACFLRYRMPLARWVVRVIILHLWWFTDCCKSSADRCSSWRWDHSWLSITATMVADGCCRSVQTMWGLNNDCLKVCKWLAWSRLTGKMNADERVRRSNEIASRGMSELYRSPWCHSYISRRCSDQTATLIALSNSLELGRMRRWAERFLISGTQRCRVIGMSSNRD